MSTDFPQLRLPKRFEDLEREVNAKNFDISQIVQRVDSAAVRIETLIRQVRDGEIGRFKLFLGISGSGKTTFFRTLSLFFNGVDVHDIPKNIPLESIAEYIRKKYVSSCENAQVLVLYDRDNAQVNNEEAKIFFESLRVLFREITGKVIILWPITDEDTSSAIPAPNISSFKSMT